MCISEKTRKGIRVKEYLLVFILSLSNNVNKNEIKEDSLLVFVYWQFLLHKRATVFYFVDKNNMPGLNTPAEKGAAVTGALASR